MTNTVLAVALVFATIAPHGAVAAVNSSCSSQLEIVVTFVPAAHPAADESIKEQVKIRQRVSETLNALCPGSSFELIGFAKSVRILYGGKAGNASFSAALLSLDEVKGKLNWAETLRLLHSRKVAGRDLNLVLVGNSLPIQPQQAFRILQQVHEDGIAHIILEPIDQITPDLQPEVLRYTTVVRTSGEVKASVVGLEPSIPAPSLPSHVPFVLQVPFLTATILVLCILCGCTSLLRGVPASTPPVPIPSSATETAVSMQN